MREIWLMEENCEIIIGERQSRIIFVELKLGIY